jgi:hypothetical protein
MQLVQAGVRVYAGLLKCSLWRVYRYSTETLPLPVQFGENLYTAETLPLHVQLYCKQGCNIAFVCSVWKEPLQR